MDRISELPDDLLLQILSLLPTKDVVPTSVLSKRWQFLWMMVPRLKYPNFKHSKFSEFVNMSLQLHKAPVLQSLHLKLGPKYGAEDLATWITLALRRCVRQLKINHYPLEFLPRHRPIRLPSTLYSCETLVALKLRGAVLVDVPLPVCLPSLKTLRLERVNYSNDESPRRLLSGCPVLENMVVERCLVDNVKTFTVAVPSLQRLFIGTEAENIEEHFDAFEIDAPCLKYFKVRDYHSDFCLIEKMPKVDEAFIDVDSNRTNKFLGSLTSVKRLSVCLGYSTVPPYPNGSIFYRLVHLELCTCQVEWWNLLVRMLKDSPNLRVLKLNHEHTARVRESLDYWNRPSSIPECLLFSLETFEWRVYGGAPGERGLMTYILRNARCLKKATISPESTDSEDEEELRVMKELAFSSRGSASYELVFN